MSKLSSEEMIKKARQVLTAESEAVNALTEQINENITNVVDMIFSCSGHVLVAGAGTSRAVAQRFAHLLACCGTPALFISAPDALHGGAGSVRQNDIVYIISKGGQSSEINSFAQIARDKGAKIIAHTENPHSPLAKLSDAVYLIKAPDKVDPYGMIATGSSLVNAAACDVLCILLLEMRGYTKEQFGKTHPGGAVGKKIESEKQ
jgi:D-arabinose 5-phosphate isomerase GutQ